MCNPHPLFEALDRQIVAPHEAVMDLKAAAAPLRDGRQDHHVVAELRGNAKARAHIHYGEARDVERLQQLRLAIAERLEHPDGTDIEELEVAREIDDSG